MEYPELNMKLFIIERDEALLSLDKSKIMIFMKAHGIDTMPTDDIVFWGGIHKAILGINSATKEQKSKSCAWLKENGYHAGC